MKYNWPLFILLFMLAGCSSLSDDNEPGDQYRESILLKANNYQGLLQLYRDRLSKGQGGDDVRLKVAEYYYLLADYEASRYYLKPLLSTKSEFTVPAYLLEAKNLMDMGNKDDALVAIDKVLAAAPENGQAHNVKGILLAEDGDFDGAMRSFAIARGEFVDDEIIMNNMAMIAILREDYPQAIEILMPLYSRGIKTTRVVHNLVFALVKNHQYKEAETIIKKENLTSSLEELIDSLEPVQSVITEKKSKPAVEDDKQMRGSFATELTENTSNAAAVTPLIDNAARTTEMTESSLPLFSNATPEPTAPATTKLTQSDVSDNQVADEKAQLRENVTALNVSPLGSVSNGSVTSVSSSVETASILSSQEVATAHDDKSLPVLATDGAPVAGTEQNAFSQRNTLFSVDNDKTTLGTVIKDIRIGDGSKSKVVRLVIESDELIRYTLTNSADNQSLIVELDNVQINDNLRNTQSYLKSNNRTIDRLTFNTLSNGNLQILFNFKHGTKSNVFSLPPDGKAGNRLVFDFSEAK